MSVELFVGGHDFHGLSDSSHSFFGEVYAYRGTAEQSLILRPGSFLVVFPEDAHRIKIAVDKPETVSKVVFKVLVYEE